MTDYIGGNPPAHKVISLTKGTDKVITLRRKDVGSNPLNWDASVWIDIDIDKTAPTRVTAVVADDVAAVRIESTTADTIPATKTGVKWRLVMSQAGSPTLETPLMVGVFERNDG